MVLMQLASMEVPSQTISSACHPTLALCRITVDQPKLMHCSQVVQLSTRSLSMRANSTTLYLAINAVRNDHKALPATLVPTSMSLLIKTAARLAQLKKERQVPSEWACVLLDQYDTRKVVALD